MMTMNYLAWVLVTVPYPKLDLGMSNLEKTSEDLHRTLCPLDIDLLVKSNGRIVICY